MKTEIFTTKDTGQFLAYLSTINKNDSSFLLIFAPVHLVDEKLLKEIQKNINFDYVVVSAAAVLDKKEFKENFIQSIFFQFEKKGKINVFYKENLSLNYEHISDFLEKKLKETQTNIIFSTTSNVALNMIIDKLGFFDGNTILAGGIASSNHPKFLTKLIYNGNTIKDGFVLLQFENVYSSVTVSSGFVPVGPAYKITKSHLNRIYEIDGISSYFFLEKILRGTGLSPEDLDMEKTSKYLWSFPFIVIEKNFGHMTFCRTPKEYSEKEGAFKFWGNFDIGDRIKISIGDPEDIVETTELDVKIFKYHLMEINAKPEFILNFSCVARYELLKKSQLQNEEAKIFRRLFLSTPVAGMLTFGEIAPDKTEKKINFYNQTSVLVALWESDV